MTILLLAIAVIALWLMLTYNRLVRLRNQQRTAWADVDVQLQRRHDLVPQLVSVTRAYAAHERATLEAVTTLRAQALATQGAAQLGTAETALAQALTRLVALQEAYPQLKADGNFTQLADALVEVEEQLQYARRFYNGAIRDYNDGRQRFPALLVARSLGFDAGEFFQADEDSRTAPKLELAQ